MRQKDVEGKQKIVYKVFQLNFQLNTYYVMQMFTFSS